MDNLIATFVFILPGFMLYFWIQMMGVTPVVKHTVPEFGAMVALCWFPVASATIGIMNLYRNSIDTLANLNEASKDLMFLLQFIGVSLVLSFLIALFYAKWGYRVQQWMVNKVRKTIGKIDLSDSPTVWEEVFFNRDVLVVGIAKIGSAKPDLYGTIQKASRPFEPRRALKLVYVEYIGKVIEKYKVPVSEVYSDVDAGIHVLIYDYAAYQKADEKERKEPEYIQTPLRSKR